MFNAVKKYFSPAEQERRERQRLRADLVAELREITEARRYHDPREARILSLLAELDRQGVK